MQLRSLLFNAALAALYAALTVALAPLSYGPVQVRLSECMTLLAFYNKKWIGGLTVGCFLANIGSPFGAVDMIVGTGATLLALLAMRFAGNLFTASLAPAIANGIIIAAELIYLAEIPADASEFIPVMLYIAAGEFLAVTVIGLPLMKLIMKNPLLKKYISE